jgi:crossover junction endodeoxyribonuclease RuvC
MRILAIDPGYERVGIAVLEKTANKKEKLIHSSCFKTPSTEPFHRRLFAIGSKIGQIIAEFKPVTFAIEQVFWGNNKKTATMVSEVRGVIIYEALKANMRVCEYTPLQVKAAISGYGRGDKRQMAIMVRHLVEINKNIDSDDEIDAIAIALTCLASEKIT